MREEAGLRVSEHYGWFNGGEGKGCKIFVFWFPGEAACSPASESCPRHIPSLRWKVRPGRQAFRSRPTVGAVGGEPGRRRRRRSGAQYGWINRSVLAKSSPTQMSAHGPYPSIRAFSSRVTGRPRPPRAARARPLRGARQGWHPAGAVGRRGHTFGPGAPPERVAPLRCDSPRCGRQACPQGAPPLRS